MDSRRGLEAPQERGKTKMSDEQKKTRQGFQGFCAGMSCRDMMRKMLEAGKSGQSFNCAEMISQMVKMRSGDAKKEKESAPNNP
jgi:hypothetical protein